MPIPAVSHLRCISMKETPNTPFLLSMLFLGMHTQVLEHKYSLYLCVSLLLKLNGNKKNADGHMK